MARLFSWFLVCLILLQTFSRELVVLNYQAQKQRITELFCVNKARPAMQCNGKCHLAKQLRKAGSTDGKAPSTSFAKLKLDAVSPLPRLRFSSHATVPSAPRRFAGFRPGYYAFTPAHGVFHPPSFQV
ncbi:hypothetical protein LJY25_19560 [Hymenobacter sp. BT175]|uniref:hypothetical protein n=1 Tax=Hymenobacter translucens TaxID=2886507 RepID=UPI001D0DCA86|nr:hypothetical protein [Hymenobacter translucens]MCC2548655.1 hypothetical protein [Hymenobacter translucens]